MLVIVVLVVSVLVLIHLFGNSALKEGIETAVSGFSFDVGCDMLLARKYCKGKVALIGYVPTIDILQNGTTRQIQEKCRQCIEQGVDVLNAGCSWPPDVPHENAMAFVNSLRYQ